MKRINTPQDKILDALFSLYMATSEQLTRLLFSENSQAYTRRNIKPLVDAGYINVLNEYTRTVNDPKVFGVGPQGWKYLKQRGHLIEKRHRDIKGKLPLGYPLRHTLAVNDLLISAMRAFLEVPNLYLLNICHEIEFKREPIVVTLPNSKLYNLRPDLMLDFELGRDRYTFMCEINLTEMNQTKYRTKVQAYYSSFPEVAKRFNTNSLFIPFFIQTPEHFPKQTSSNPDLAFELRAVSDRAKRLQDLIDWTTEEQEKASLKEHDLFLFSHIPIHSLSPTDLFFGPHWKIPFSNETFSLMDQP